MLPKKPNAYFLLKIIFLLFYYQINMIYTADLDTTLTNIIKYSLNDLTSTYVAIITTEKRNLICSASYYQTSTLKYYYGLKPNGRPYFIKNSKNITSEIIIFYIVLIAQNPLINIIIIILYLFIIIIYLDFYFIF